jgi:hypothetical protein
MYTHLGYQLHLALHHSPWPHFQHVLMTEVVALMLSQFKRVRFLDVCGIDGFFDTHQVIPVSSSSYSLAQHQMEKLMD